MYFCFARVVKLCSFASVYLSISALCICDVIFFCVSVFVYFCVCVLLCLCFDVFIFFYIMLASVCSVVSVRSRKR